MKRPNLGCRLGLIAVVLTTGALSQSDPMASVIVVEIEETRVER